MGQHSMRWLAAAALFVSAAVAAPATLRGQVMVVSGTLDEAGVHPGEAHAGLIRVRNNGTTVQRAQVYQADYRFFADGRSLYEVPGSQPRSNAAWMDLGAGSLTLAPGEEGSIRFEVRVPADPSLQGTYWSVVMVETEAAPVPRTGRGVGITPVIRYAVQVATHVGRAAEARLAFQAPRVDAGAGGGRELAVDVANTGDLAERVEIRLDLFEADGTPARRLQASRGLLYPGTSLRQTFDLGHLPPGVYRALVVADTGAEELFGTEYTIRL